MKEEKEYVATRNACKLCNPLGACLAYKGIKGCVPLIHGSQGCSTYIRRYMISHFREPVDIASSNFTEESTIFGGRRNCHQAITNIIKQYNPEVIAASTTCLSETIGDDIGKYLNEYKAEFPASPEFIFAHTPSYQGTHADGFHEAVASTVRSLAKRGKKGTHINLFPGMFSPADLRYLKRVMEKYNQEFMILPDYSETLDGSSWSEYKRIPDGGTPVGAITNSANAQVSIELGTIFNQANGSSSEKKKLEKETAASFLDSAFEVPAIRLPWPIGVEATDRLFMTLSEVTGIEKPEEYVKERGRLIDAYADGHKYVFGKKAVIYGEEDLVLSIYAFLTEIGVDTILVASGGKSGALAEEINKLRPGAAKPEIIDNADFEEIASRCRELHPDLLIGHSKGYYIARELSIPLIRIGFPIHDRLGGQRVLHIGYEGTNDLFEKIVNAVIEYNQNHSEVGYKYM